MIIRADAIDFVQPNQHFFESLSAQTELYKLKVDLLQDCRYTQGLRHGVEFGEVNWCQFLWAAAN